jgi:hypothetical protein
MTNRINCDSQDLDACPAAVRVPGPPRPLVRQVMTVCLHSDPMPVDVRSDHHRRQRGRHPSWYEMPESKLAGWVSHAMGPLTVSVRTVC